MKRLTVLIIALLLATPPASGEEMPAFNKKIPAYGEEMPLFDKESFIANAGIKKNLEIGMVDCVALALKSNSEILIRRIQPLIEDANVRIQKSRFEPKFSFDFTMEDNTDLSTSTLIGQTTSKTRTGTFNFGYDEKFVTGTQLAVDMLNTRTRSNSIVQSMNPEYNSEAQVTVTQPLLKGFGIVVNKADFFIAKNNKAKSTQDLKKNIIDVLTNVKKAYYEFQYSEEQYRVARTSLERVQNLHYINKEKYSKGLASNVDLLESEADVARFEQAVYGAEAMMKTAEDNLKYATNLVDDPELWNANIVLLNKVGYEKRETTLTKSIITAFDYRPDYEAGKIDLKNRDISVIFYRNNMLPTLDLSASYGLNGLGQNYEKDLGHIGGGKYQDWAIGVVAKIPLFSDEEKGKYEKSKLDKRAALIAFKRLEQKIVLEVRDAVRNVETKLKILEAAKKNKDAQTENFAAQETRFRAGLVSTLDILIYQENLAKAELNYLRSVVDYDENLIELARAQGTTLVEENIKLEDI